MQRIVYASRDGLTVSQTIPLRELIDVTGEAESRSWLDSYRPEYNSQTGVITLSRPKGNRINGNDVQAIRKSVGPIEIADALKIMSTGECDRYGSNVKEIFSDFLKYKNGENIGYSYHSMYDNVLQVAFFGFIAYG